jgi:hypothetical protein
MKLGIRIAASALLLAIAAAPLEAQQRDLVIGIYGGGADHLADLQSNPSVWLMPGYSFGGSVGLQLSRHFAVHAAFTYARTPSEGHALFAGSDIVHYYSGVHLEGRYPLGALAPYAFVGVGGAAVDQQGLDQFDPFSKPAAMLGGGLAWQIPGSPFEALGQVQGISYKWNAAGFDRQLFDVTYSLGIRYRVPVVMPF